MALYGAIRVLARVGRLRDFFFKLFLTFEWSVGGGGGVFNLWFVFIILSIK